MDVCSMLVFTDGLANIGYSKTNEITREMAKLQQKLQKTVSVTTFGFGADHDANMLRAIAEAGRGMYYFVETAEQIPNLFADCLGGLLSIIAQDIKLQVSTLGSTSVVRLLGNYQHKLSQDHKELEIVLGDIYSGEKKNFIFVLELSATTATDEQKLVAVDVSYYHCLLKKKETSSMIGSVKRPDKIDHIAFNYELDKNRNRLEALEAMDAARKLADAGKLQEAKDVLNKAIARLESSISSKDAATKANVDDLKLLLGTLKDKQEYSTRGNKMMNQMYFAKHEQRSNSDWQTEANAEEEMSVRQDTKSKQAMRSKAKAEFK
jgi:hypothetical protein